MNYVRSAYWTFYPLNTLLRNNRRFLRFARTIFFFKCLRMCFLIKHIFEEILNTQIVLSALNSICITKNTNFFFLHEYYRFSLCTPCTVLRSWTILWIIARKKFRSYSINCSNDAMHRMNPYSLKTTIV